MLIEGLNIGIAVFQIHFGFTYFPRPSHCDHQEKGWSIIYTLMVQLMLTRVLVATLALALGAAIS